MVMKQNGKTGKDIHKVTIQKLHLSFLDVCDSLLKFFVCVWKDGFHC